MLNLMKKSAPFSPPYGDGTEFMMKKACDNKFSPPYGDGTRLFNPHSLVVKFSPPYGDGTSR